MRPSAARALLAGSENGTLQRFAEGAAPKRKGPVARIARERGLRDLEFWPTCLKRAEVDSTAHHSGDASK